MTLHELLKSTDSHIIKEALVNELEFSFPIFMETSKEELIQVLEGSALDLLSLLLCVEPTGLVDLLYDAFNSTKRNNYELAHITSSLFLSHKTDDDHEEETWEMT